MASVLQDFTKRREFLVCMDSDGCVMDTVRTKHVTVMCPELIRIFALEEQADFVRSAWEEINLHTITRGISRFESVVLVFDRLRNRGIELPGSEDIAAWVNTAAELSTASLQKEILKTGSPALRKLQEWNNVCNRRIQLLEPTFKPFPYAEDGLRQLHAVADLAVVSAANESAIASEWKRYGLAKHADVIFGRKWAVRPTPSLPCWPAAMRAARWLWWATPWAMHRRPPPTVWRLYPSCRDARLPAGAACRRRPCPSCCTEPLTRSTRLSCWRRCAVPCMLETLLHKAEKTV